MWHVGLAGYVASDACRLDFIAWISGIPEFETQILCPRFSAMEVDSYCKVIPCRIHTISNPP